MNDSTTTVGTRWRPRRLRTLAALIAAATVVTLAASGSAQASTPQHRRVGDFLLRVPVDFYVEQDTNAGRQADIYQAQGRLAEADAMRRLSRVSQAVWFTAGTPSQVRADVATTVDAALRQHQVPVLVAYYIPGRDCSQYSAGGAPSEAVYGAWIDAFATGIGDRPAVVILEPDGLALLSSEPWCGEGGGGFTGQPEDFARVDERFREINGAVDRLRQNRFTAVYLDAGHSSWQQINDYDAGYGVPSQQLGMASRLMRAGVERATGFFLNVSNYQTTGNLVDYGTRLSGCIQFRQQTGAANCGPADIAGISVNPLFLTHFVVDTSRNGQGPWTPPAGLYADPQDWCNPPGRGLGATPTTRTGNPLVDAYLWVKRPGESDGSCTRGTAGQADPEYGAVDPLAGQWWPEYALGLVARANPPLPD
jgi:endoglucanase